MTTCAACGSDWLEYQGVDDGGGDYGDSVCDNYDCLKCGYSFEAHCMSEDAFDIEGGPDLTEEEQRRQREADYEEQERRKANLKTDDTDDIPW